MQSASQQLAAADSNVVRCSPLEVKVCMHVSLCVCVCVYSYFSLEAAEELCQVGVFSGQGQDAFLSQSAVHVVVLQDHVFLQHFDSVNLIAAFQLRQHHLVT